ncbi:hypothetical protein JOF28_001325 [Leucobacter exalbidus]|uniref:Uncharacterized protein n=1 Tax=Leucobacter exalbidus TaxID=662960 RepID=A0A940PMW6_9MICO|nr:hypothetical protein [Leucobacter exalbidus]MBP1326093.1 hypothetical protein [Leucobacter exalbidus]
MANPIRFISTGAAAAALVLLAGCASTDTASTPKVPTSPLEEYFQQIDELTSQEDTDTATQFEAIELAVAECMISEGFEYEPEKWVDIESDDEVDEGPEWGSIDFAKTYGFGIAAWPGSEASDEDTTAEVESEEVVSANQTYYDSLSSSEQDAYLEALYGVDGAVAQDPGDLTFESDELSDEGFVEENTNAVPGCYQKGAEEVTGTGDTAAAIYDDPAYQDLWDSLDDFYADLETPKAVETIDAEWQKCMDSKGLAQVATDGRENVAAQLYEEYDNLTVSPDGVEIIDLDEEAIAEFTKREIEVAVPDAECAVKVNYDVRLQEAYNELEQEFVSQHKAQLDALLAGANKQTK